jgi:hypothetical protein
MNHNLPKEVTNSAVEYCISEYVRNYEHREMLRDKWFRGMTLEGIADKYHLSDTRAKEILYGCGDDVITRALKM